MPPVPSAPRSAPALSALLQRERQMRLILVIGAVEYGHAQDRELAVAAGQPGLLPDRGEQARASPPVTAGLCSSTLYRSSTLPRSALMRAISGASSGWSFSSIYGMRAIVAVLWLVIRQSERQLGAGLRGPQHARKSAWMRSSAACVSPSKRSTITGVVLEARARPKPSAYSTRRPSSVMISRAPGKRALCCSSAISAVRLAFGQLDVELRRVDRIGQRVEQPRSGRRAARRFRAGARRRTGRRRSRTSAP